MATVMAGVMVSKNKMHLVRCGIIILRNWITLKRGKIGMGGGRAQWGEARNVFSSV